MKRPFGKAFLIAVAVASALSITVFLTYTEGATGLKTKFPPKLRGWYLVWHDEFEANELDKSKWRIEDAALVKNNELQYYSPDEVYVHDGVLTLRSRQREMGGRAYTSGLVETKGKFSFQYGRVEVRAKLPRTKGMWPAHWMMPENGGWPPEIDIMELIGSFPKKVHMTNHYGKWPHNRYDTATYTGPDFTGGFHIFALEWEAGEIRWYIDGVQRFAVTRHIPQEPFYVILNTAVGGTMPSNPDNTTVFPQYHDIDYVRVYLKEIPGTFFLMTSAENGNVTVEPKKDRYQRGAKVKLTAMPKIGYKFSGWRGDILISENPAVITMNKHRKIAANFVTDPNAPKVISSGKEAYASSIESQSLIASNAFDGTLTTRWSSEFSDPQWLYVDLGKEYLIEAVRLQWEAAQAKEYKLQVSDDAKDWNTVYATENSKDRTEEIRNINAKGRYVRMYGEVRKTEYGYSLWEFEVFGREVEAPAVEQ